jgi:sorting nexin-29
LPDQLKESIIVPVNKKDDKIECNNYHGISLLSTSYKSLSNILLSRLGPYVDKIIGDHQCGFRRNRSILIRFFHSSDTVEKYKSTMRQYISYSQTSIKPMI